MDTELIKRRDALIPPYEDQRQRRRLPKSVANLTDEMPFGAALQNIGSGACAGCRDSIIKMGPDWARSSLWARSLVQLENRLNGLFEVRVHQRLTRSLIPVFQCVNQLPVISEPDFATDQLDDIDHGS